jgi:hypothetical protein
MFQDSAFDWRDFWRGAVRLFTGPRDLFSREPREGGYKKPVIYALAWFFVTAVLETLVSYARGRAEHVGIGFDIAWILLGPWLMTGFLFPAAAGAFVIWHLMGSNGDFRFAFACLSLMAPLAAAGALLGLVPYLNIAVMLYSIYLLVVASQAAHNLSAQKSWVVWGVLGGGLLILLLMAAATTVRDGALMAPGAGFEQNTSEISGAAVNAELENQLKSLKDGGEKR